MNKDLLKEIERYKENQPIVGAPRTSKSVANTSREGTKRGETRATYLVEIELVEKIREIALENNVRIKDLINTALREFINKYDGREERKDI